MPPVINAQLIKLAFELGIKVTTAAHDHIRMRRAKKLLTKDEWKVLSTLFPYMSENDVKFIINSVRENMNC